jgi:O-glycosyl hydrolase
MTQLIKPLRHTLVLGALLTLAPTAYADGTVSVTREVLHTIRGFGLFPAPYDREMPTYSDGSLAWGDATWLGEGTTRRAIHDLVAGSGMDIARTYVSPAIGSPDGTLDRDRLQDLEDHLAILRDGGVGDWIVTSWSPPVHMKQPDQVRYGTYQGREQHLNPAYVDGYATFLAEVLATLRDDGFAPPLAISIQNEPDMAVIYDGCVYANDTGVYRNVVVALRQALDARGLESVAIHAPEHSTFLGIQDFLGEPSAAGFAGLAADPSYANAIGGFAWHTYATAGNIGAIAAAMRAYPGRDRWMTEYSGARWTGP